MANERHNNSLKGHAAAAAAHIHTVRVGGVKPARHTHTDAEISIMHDGGGG